MKFAVHLSIFTKKWGDEISPLIFLANEIGFDGVELPLLNPFEIDIKPIKKALNETGLIPLCSTGLSLKYDISSQDETIRQQGIEFLKRCIDIAYELDSRYLNGLTYSPWGLLQSKAAGAAQLKTIEETLVIVADYAQSKDVFLNLEVVNRYETYVINTVDEALELIANVNHPNLGIHYDTFHANIEEKSQYDAIKSGGKLIRHIHFASNFRGTPGEGSIDFSQISKAIKEIEYDHFISLENAVEPNCEVGNGFNIWRPLAKDGYTAAEKGLKAMRKIMS